MVNKIDLLHDSEFTKLIENNFCIADVLRELGYSVKGNSWAYQIVRERMDKLGLSFVKKNLKLQGSKKPSLSLDEITIKDSNYNRTKLKERLFKAGLKERKCECCGITEWQGKPLSFELHHLNGVNNDNRLSNLQVLCPNCHSQTSNFGTRGKGASIIRKAESMSKEDVDLIMSTVRELGIVEARKKLSFRNSLINSVVKMNRDIVIMISPDSTEKEFTTTMSAAKYLFEELHLGKSIESNRSNISKCLSGKQKTAAGGYKFYRRSVEA